MQVVESTSTVTNSPVTRYWMWRFDRPDDPVSLEDFWGKTTSQAVSDLQSTNDPTIGVINGPSDVELTVDAYFPNTIPTVDPALKGRTIHGGGRNRQFLDYHVAFTQDANTCPNNSVRRAVFNRLRAFSALIRVDAFAWTESCGPEHRREAKQNSQRNAN